MGEIGAIALYFLFAIAIGFFVARVILHYAKFPKAIPEFPYNAAALLVGTQSLLVQHFVRDQLTSLLTWQTLRSNLFFTVIFFLPIVLLGFFCIVFFWKAYRGQLLLSGRKLYVLCVVTVIIQCFYLSWNFANA